MPAGQKPSQQRSRQRRELLLRAALELLAEGGAKAVTHRAVATRAGLPLASTTYYFESIQQLTEEALQLEVAERIVALEALADVRAFAGRTAEEFATQLVDALVERRGGEVVAQFEVYLEAARNPALERPVANALAAFERLASDALAALGARQPEQAATAFVALLDGFALHRVARPIPTDVEAEAMLDAIKALFVAQVMTPDELDHWHARLREPLPDSPEAAEA
jgi:DNA-binding transcriptional regulator YbjK